MFQIICQTVDTGMYVLDISIICNWVLIWIAAKIEAEDLMKLNDA